MRCYGEVGRDILDRIKMINGIKGRGTEVSHGGGKRIEEGRKKISGLSGYGGGFDADRRWAVGGWIGIGFKVSMNS